MASPGLLMPETPQKPVTKELTPRQLEPLKDKHVLPPPPNFGSRLRRFKNNSELSFLFAGVGLLFMVPLTFYYLSAADAESGGEAGSFHGAGPGEQRLGMGSLDPLDPASLSMSQFLRFAPAREC